MSIDDSHDDNYILNSAWCDIGLLDGLVKEEKFKIKATNA